jgi:RND family efflux transporter MFP subunit
MQKLSIITIVFAVLLAACGEQSSSLEEKRAELEEKREHLAALTDSIKALEQEILELDTTITEKATAVIADKVERSTFKNPFRIQGVVSSNQNVDVSPEVGGTITQITIKEGQRVSKGQVIARLDASAVSSQLAELRTALKLAKVAYEKQERLWKKNIGSEMQYLQAKNNYESLQSRINTAEVQIGKFTITSPISGSVDAIYANAGELTGAGRPIARIVSGGDMKIIADVSETYLGAVKQGDEVKVHYPSLNKTVTEKVFAVGDVINPENRTFRITIKPSSKNLSLKPNLLAIITAYDYVQDNVISVPTKLVRDDGQGTYLMVAQKDEAGLLRAMKRPIEVSRTFADYTIVESGLKEGDRVIVEGYSSVVNKELLQVVEEQDNE